jgi:hypothetical protein
LVWVGGCPNCGVCYSERTGGRAARRVTEITPVCVEV